jgi:hypothetical protein
VQLREVADHPSVREKAADVSSCWNQIEVIRAVVLLIALNSRCRLADSVSMTIWLVSTLDRGGRAAVDREAYPAQRVRSETGIGAATASGH